MRDDIKIPWKEQIVWLLIFIAVFFTIKHFIYRINDDEAVSAIVGEASNQSYDTMVCVAQGIRHRGTLKGVYGVHARHNADESEDTWLAAENAWEDSAIENDHIKGAKNWGTKSDLLKLGIEYYSVKCGDLYFY